MQVVKYPKYQHHIFYVKELNATCLLDIKDVHNTFMRQTKNLASHENSTRDLYIQ